MIHFNYSRLPIVVFDPANIFYLSGIKVDNGALLITKTEKYLFVNPLSLMDYPKDRIRILFYKTNRQFQDLLKDALSPFRRVYTDSVEKLQNMSHLTPRKSSFLAAARAHKDMQEIEKIKKAISISETALRQILPLIREGISELDLKAEIEYKMFKLGAAGLAFPTIVAFSENAALPHYSPSYQRRLKYGDVILIDWGAKYGGYCADITRMVVFGEEGPVAEEIKSVLKRVETLVNILLDKLMAGERQVTVLNRIYREALGKTLIKHSLGHGFGIEVHEAPTLRNGVCLKEGNTVTVEPGAYIFGRFGVRIEEDVWIKQNSIEKLTNLPKIIVL